MRKRNLIIAVMLLALAGVAVAWVKDAFFFEPGVTVRNFQRLHLGMSEGEIEDILGQNGETLQKKGVLNASTTHGFPKTWIGEECFVHLEFGLPPDVIANREYFGVLRTSPTKTPGPLPAYSGYCVKRNGERIELAAPSEPFLDKLRRWVGW